MDSEQLLRELETLRRTQARNRVVSWAAVILGSSSIAVCLIRLFS